MNPLLSCLLFLATVVTVSGQIGYYGNPFFGYGGYGYGFRPYDRRIPYWSVGPYGGGNVGFGSGLFSPTATPLQNALRGAAIGALYGLVSG
uniref:Glycine rich superfamily member n=1 Tax=Angiostrongylus cantonensis TaxID=6313 RepID=A0A0K0CV19_ANGCA